MVLVLFNGENVISKTHRIDIYQSEKVAKGIKESSFLQTPSRWLPNSAPLSTQATLTFHFEGPRFRGVVWRCHIFSFRHTAIHRHTVGVCSEAQDQTFRCPINHKGAKRRSFIHLKPNGALLKKKKKKQEKRKKMI